MRLAEFILTDMDSIVAEWELFAATLLPAAASMTPLALRDHAQQILEAVAKDLQTPQTQQAQADKSKGKAPQRPGAPETAAQTHAVLRAQSGFNINQLVAEYRALRASVLHLWMKAHPAVETKLEDVVRFNEAIDQAIAESVGFFSAHVEQTRNLFLGMLGHDMRNPLNTILMTATYLAAIDAGTSVSEAASRLIRSGSSMKTLLDDLIDFNRTQLGLGIRMTLTEVDLSSLFEDEVDQLRGSNPGRLIELDVSGDTRGFWDGTRLQQLLRNLVSNGIKYGAADGAIRIVLTGGEEDVVCEVTNSGPALERSFLEQMFLPLERGPDPSDSRNGDDEGLGLGLYIVREIASAHGGKVSVRSSEAETVFTVRLPR
ncbi:MAG: sensor histidine kinase [Methylobacter sp.]